MTFSVEGVAADMVKRRMAGHKINVTHSTVYSTRLDMENRGLEAIVRASLHYYNTEQEIGRFMDVLAQEMGN